MSSGQKGVMLCQRPGPSQMDSSPGPKPFLPSSNPSGLEPLGLAPTLKTYPPSISPKVPSINLKSHSVVRDLEEENRLAALQQEESRRAEAARANNVTAFGAQLRAAILSGDDVSFWKAARHTDEIKQALETSKARAAAAASTSFRAPPAPDVTPPSYNSAAATANTATTITGAADIGTRKEDMLSFVDDLLREATVALDSPSAAAVMASSSLAAVEAVPLPRSDGTHAASTSGDCGDGVHGIAAAARVPTAAPSSSTPRRKGRGGSKPAWALTADEVSRLEDAEEEDLLQFAEGLDFDSFMSALDDPELQRCVKASSNEGGKGPAPGEEKAWRKNLVRAMNHVAMKRVAVARRDGTAGSGDDDEDHGSVAAGSEGGASFLSRPTAASRLKSEAGTTKRSVLSEVVRGDGDGSSLVWDSSTRASEDVGRMDRGKVAAREAFEFLRENPELRAVHSPASVRALVSKADLGTATKGADSS